MCSSYGFYWGLGEAASSQSGMLFLTHAMRNTAISELAVGSSKGLIYSKFARLEGETTIYEGEAPVKGESRKLATVTHPPQHILDTLALLTFLSLVRTSQLPAEVQVSCPSVLR